jgi:hypothetical protein
MQYVPYYKDYMCLMNIPITLSNSGYKGYFYVVEDEMILKNEMTIIFHYSAVLDLSENKVRLIIWWKWMAN